MGGKPERKTYIIVIVLLLLLPVVFCYSFQGDKESHFLFFHSTLGGDDWFSFWISYISMLVTAVLAYYAYRFSVEVEKTQFLRQIECDKTKFRVTEIFSDDGKIFKLILPMDIISVQNVRILKALLLLPNIEEGEDDKSVELEIKNKKKLKGCQIILEIPMNSGEETKYERELLLWQQQMFNRTERFFSAIFKIKFSYKIKSPFTKNVKIIQMISIAKVVVTLDENKTEDYKIIDVGVRYLKMK